MWLSANHIPTSSSLHGTRFDRSFMAIQAAIDGLGIALDSEVFADIDLREGRLVIPFRGRQTFVDRKSTRLNSSHANISYAVFCLKKKIIHQSINIRSIHI